MAIWNTVLWCLNKYCVDINHMICKKAVRIHTWQTAYNITTCNTNETKRIANVNDIANNIVEIVRCTLIVARTKMYKVTNKRKREREEAILEAIESYCCIFLHDMNIFTYDLVFRWILCNESGFQIYLLSDDHEYIRYYCYRHY